MIMARVLHRAGRNKVVGCFSFAALVLVALPGCDKAPDLAQKRGEAQPFDTVESFLKEHWARPLGAQGMPPTRFSPLEASLAPRSCGTCHVAQYDDWKTSLHGQAMGPGVLGQLVNHPPEATEEHQECLRCHAPLKEQADSLVASLAAGAGARRPHDPERALHEQGLVCAACHVRGHRRYGPPRKDGSSPDPTAQLPHDGWVVTSAFGDSRFCAACHQFSDDGYALNGKLLENTYEEWKASRYAREGKSCQSCHMPERRHLWRGIHDQAMVKGGVTVEVTPTRIQSGVVSATLTIRNTGTAHYFPTYVTPRVVTEAYQEGADGRMLKETLRQYIVARQVSLDLTEEIADTRIAPDERAVFEYRAPLAAGAAAVAFRVRVEPDAFYTNLYRSLLQGNDAGKGQRLIKQALDNSLASHFTFYTSRHSLTK